jgi:hypothetical protein
MFASASSSDQSIWFASPACMVKNGERPSLVRGIPGAGVVPLVRVE